MLKKILIGVGILAVLGVIFIVGAGYYAMNKIIEEKEPEFRKYITMTTEEQNSYVENNLDFLLSAVIQDAKTDEEKATFEKIKADPEVKKSGVELGRAILAKMILSSDVIVSELNEETKSKLQAESEEVSKRFEIYSNIMEKYDTK